jgi:uncharacterized membrane protein
MTNKENSIASALTIIAVLVMVCGIISGFYFGSSNEFYGVGDMQGIVGFGVMVNGIIWGIVLLGFAEVIKLLQGIFNQREVLIPENKVSDKVESLNIPREKMAVTDTAINEIKSFYDSKQIKVIEVHGTINEDFYRVTLEDGRTEIVELGWFKPKITD